MRIDARVTTIAVGVLLGALAAHAADLAGKWAAEFDTQVGMQKYTFYLAVVGDKVTGKASFERMGQKGEADLLEGKLVGDKVSFVETFDAMGSPVRIEYEGTVKGDEIAFTRKVGEFATEQFTAKRARD
jgi:hypothetical protein